MEKKPGIMENYPALPTGFTEVGAGSWKTAQLINGEQPLGTVGVYSCTVVALKNVETARIYLGHFFHPNFAETGDREQFDAMINAVKDNEDPVHGLEAWVSGASYFGVGKSEIRKIHDEEVQADRKYVSNTLSSMQNLVSLAEEWPQDRESLSIVTFHPMRDPAIECVREFIDPEDQEV